MTPVGRATWIERHGVAAMRWQPGRPLWPWERAANARFFAYLRGIR